MKAAISGLGVWFPARVRTNDEYPPEFVAAARKRGDRMLVDIPAEGLTEADRLVSRLAQEDQADPFLGAVERRVADDSLTSWEAELFAARNALADAQLTGDAIDVVLGYSTCPDRPGPAGAHKVASELGARGWALGIDAGCASSVLQLALAKSLIESGQARNVLAVQSNLMNRVVPFMHPVSPSIGDGAAAVVVSASERSGILGVESVSQGEFYESVCYVRGTDDATDPPWYREGGPFVLGSRDPESMRQVMQQTVGLGAETVRQALRQAQLEPSDLDLFCVTQPRRFIPFAIAEFLGVPRENTPNTFAEYGHVGACAVYVNLWRARADGRVRPGSVIGLYSQGIGFARSAAVLRWQPDLAG